MNWQLKYIFVLTLIFSVFSLSSQASMTHFFKENKTVKSQDSSNPLSDEESPDDSDEETGEELLYSEHSSFYLLSQKDIQSIWNHLLVKVQSHSVRIPVPPPRF